MALISMGVWDTEDNRRSEYTLRTLQSLMRTVNLARHRIHVTDNASCKRTKDILKDFSPYITIHTLDQNLGTAKAVNIGWSHRTNGEHCVKMDNDVVIHQKDWCDELEDAISRDPNIGIIGLKRKDCWENVKHDNPFYRSELVQLPHEGGQRWIVVEKVRHVMGTCQMFNSLLLDKIGYLYQPTKYGFDDCLASTRSEVAGFYNAFLPHIDIDHIDTGETEYQGWKEKISGDAIHEFSKTTQDYRNGVKPIYSDKTW